MQEKKGNEPVWIQWSLFDTVHLRNHHNHRYHPIDRYHRSGIHTVSVREVRPLLYRRMNHPDNLSDCLPLLITNNVFINWKRSKKFIKTLQKKQPKAICKSKPVEVDPFCKKPNLQEKLVVQKKPIRKNPILQKKRCFLTKFRQAMEVRRERGEGIQLELFQKVQQHLPLLPLQSLSKLLEHPITQHWFSRQSKRSCTVSDCSC